MIIGVALVVDELHKGQRLVCRYPESKPSSILNTDEGLLKFHQDNLSISPDNFAKLFRPKPALFNQVVELTIDDICYLSFACPCAEELSSESNIAGDIITMFNIVISTVRESSLRRVLGLNFQSSTDTLGKPATYTGVEDLRRVGCDPMTAAMGLREGIHPVSNIMLRKVIESFSRALLHQEKRYKYVSMQVAIMLKLHDSNIERAPKRPAVTVPPLLSEPTIQYPETTEMAAEEGNNDTNNNIASQIDKEASVGGEMDSNSHVAGSSSNVDNQMVLESFLLVMELMLHKSSLANEIRSLYHGLVGGHSINLTINGVLSISIQLQDFGSAATPFSLSLPPSRNTSSSCLVEADTQHMALRKGHSPLIAMASKDQEADPQRGPQLKPFQTLLFIADADVLTMLMVGSLDPSNYSNVLPHWSLRTAATPATSANGIDQAADCSLPGKHHAFGSASTNSNSDAFAYSTHQQFIHPTILGALQMAKPTMSFVELSVLMGIPLTEIYLVANHFCSWGLARVINTITMSSCFKVHSQAPTAADSRVAGVFAATFPTAGFFLENAAYESNNTQVVKSGQESFLGSNSNAPLLLHRILSAFDGQTSIGQAISQFPSDLQPIGVQVVVWLVRWRMLEEVSIYLVRTGPELHSLESDSVKISPSRQSELRRRNSHGSSIADRLAPYLDGKIDLFEICWREGLDEDEVLAVVEQDDSVLTLAGTTSM